MTETPKTKKRLTKIITRTGDKGTTGLGDGTRVSKASLRMMVIGEIDELNAHLGLLLTEALPEDLRALLIRLQHELFELGGEVCIPGSARMTEAHIVFLEETAETLNARLPALTNFILPGGTTCAAYAHVVRAIARRLERGMVALSETEPVSELSRKYVNRLSDLFFILARTFNLRAEKSDVLWSQVGRA